ncbi:imidazoleglycerol-phosphate dehydratase HisB [Calderihabitans maritimus]|uniref:Imidazoleglycerol-phosphate dehydratase n=1 Tax=Calderihabitans maritimus TaxID=1246530 RepID=A0A1Z5HQG5_9FIRM|nr:imidazoleglycerol-phosphate dehydratase HisB [Calderihabitans maritimus]GAW91551.1 imidazoleglycerol-phosphate dehydratase [Calderihabitans maritimus]
MNRERKVQFSRKTEETDITVNINLDGRGLFEGQTGIGFMDHMLHLWTKHALFDLALEATGDLQVDDHHTVEDLGICLGEAVRNALGDKKGVNRYGHAVVPMDEALVEVVLDLSGRPYLAYEVSVPSTVVGQFATELVEEFLRAFVNHSFITLHVRMLRGKNSHHIIEAVFKAFGRALRQAVARDPRIEGIMSTKGIL